MSSVEEKQAYLRREVLDKGYDPDNFLTFILSVDEQRGDDLALWTMEELEQLVSDFKANEEQNQIVSKSRAPSILPEDELRNSLTAPNQNFNQKTSENLSSSDYIEIFQNRKVKNTPLNTTEGPVNVIFASPEIHQGTLFVKSYLTYGICAFPLPNNVVRKYNDFKWLNDILSVVYPGRVFPPLPKKPKYEKWDDKVIGKSKRALQKFIQGLVDDPVISHSQILYDFLSIEKESNFFSRKTYYSKEKTARSLNETFSTNGYLRLKLSPNDQEKISQIKNATNQTEAVLKKIKSSFKQLISSMETTSSIMKEIASLSLQMDEISNGVKDVCGRCDAYRILSSLMEQWSAITKKQSDMIDLDLREQLKFVMKQCPSMRKIYEKCDEKRSIFYKLNEKLSSRKEELFRKGSISKWGLSKEDLEDKDYLMKNKSYAINKMLPKETNVLFGHKRAYAFYNTMTIDEYERIMKQNNLLYANNFIDLGKGGKELLKDMNIVFDEMITFLEATVRNEKNLDGDDNII